MFIWRKTHKLVGKSPSYERIFHNIKSITLLLFHQSSLPKNSKRFTGVSVANCFKFEIIYPVKCLLTLSIKHPAPQIGNDASGIGRTVSKESLTLTRPGPKVIKLFSCCVEHEILNPHKYENIEKFDVFRLR